MTDLDPAETPVAFPPAPWTLTGHMTLLLWNVPTSLVADRVPDGLTPLSLAGRSLLGTAWVRYDEGGMLAYNELLAAVHVRDGWRPRQSITDIWVDSAVSRDGGRALWGIPKDLAHFGLLDGRSFACGLTHPAQATATFRPAPIPATGPRMRAGWSMVQERGGQRVHSRTRLRGRVRPGRASMVVEADGPLGFLARRRPFLALQIIDMQVTFGV